MRNHTKDFERRRKRHEELLESSDPFCTMCGEDDWRCLESKFSGDREYDDFTVILCLNCLRKYADGYRRKSKGVTRLFQG
jgi:hypothetical protein